MNLLFLLPLITFLKIFCFSSNCFLITSAPDHCTSSSVKLNPPNCTCDECEYGWK